MSGGRELLELLNAVRVLDAVPAATLSHVGGRRVHKLWGSISRSSVVSFAIEEYSN